MNNKPPIPPVPNDDGLSAAFYTTMRDELMKRLELRERTLALTATVLAALLGFGASAEKFKPYILLVMAPLSLGSTILVLEHSSKLAFIAEYLDKECRRFIRMSGSTSWRPWEVSSQLRDARRQEYKLRGLGEALILLLPLVVALVLASPDEWVFSSKEGIAWIIGTIVALIVIFLIIRHFIWRQSYHQYSASSHDNSN